MSSVHFPICFSFHFQLYQPSTRVIMKKIQPVTCKIARAVTVATIGTAPLPRNAMLGKICPFSILSLCSSIVPTFLKCPWSSLHRSSDLIWVKYICCCSSMFRPATTRRQYRGHGDNYRDQPNSCSNVLDAVTPSFLIIIFGFGYEWRHKKRLREDDPRDALVKEIVFVLDDGVEEFESFDFIKKYIHHWMYLCGCF